MYSGSLLPLLAAAAARFVRGAELMVGWPPEPCIPVHLSPSVSCDGKGLSEGAVTRGQGGLRGTGRPLLTRPLHAAAAGWEIPLAPHSPSMGRGRAWSQVTQSRERMIAVSP